jgi:hypothetical protein
MEVDMSNQNWSHNAALLGITAGALLVMQERLDTIREKETRLEDAREDYYRSLRALEKAAGDQALKEEAFIRGIVYAGLMRDARRDREFDEETVTADIERALRLGKAARAQENAGALERLRELQTVREAGLITEEEYEKKRAEIMASI